MILIDVFHILISMAEKILNKPDDIIEYYDKDLQTLGESKEFMKVFINSLPVDTNGLNYPNSEAQKRLKAITDFWNDIVQFQNYLDSKAADARDRQRAVLIAMAVFEALLSHKAMVSEFWDSLSDQYIQYLQNRLDNLRNMLEKSDADIVKLNFEINGLVKRIDAIDKNIVTEMKELINVSQERVDRVSEVVTSSFDNHLENLGALNQNLANFVKEKESSYMQAVAEYEAFLKANPNAPASTLEGFLGAINVSKQELAKSSDLLHNVEKISKDIVEAKHEFSMKRNDLDSKIQVAEAPRERLKLMQEREQLVKDLLSTFYVKQDSINDLSKQSETLSKEIPSLSSDILNIMNNFKDSKSLIESVDKISLSKQNVLAQSISDKFKMRDKLDNERQSLSEQLKDKMSEQKDLKSQLKQTENYLNQFTPHGVYVRQSTIEPIKTLPLNSTPSPFSSSNS